MPSRKDTPQPDDQEARLTDPCADNKCTAGGGVRAPKHHDFDFLAETDERIVGLVRELRSLIVKDVLTELRRAGGSDSPVTDSGAELEQPNLAAKPQGSGG